MRHEFAPMLSHRSPEDSRVLVTWVSFRQVLWAGAVRVAGASGSAIGWQAPQTA